MTKRKYKKKVTIWDLDDTCCHFLPELCRLHNKLYGTCVNETDIQDWNFDSLEIKDARGNIVTGKQLRETFKEYEEHGLYSILPFISDAKQTLMFVKKLGYKIIFLTARPPKFEKATILNLIKNDIDYDELYFEEDKVKKIKELSKIYNVQLFVDDKASTVEQVNEKCKVNNVYLINKSYNRDEEVDEDVIRIDNIMECLKKLKDLN